MSSDWRLMALGALALAVCVAQGMQIAYQSQQVRALHAELQQNQLAQDALLAEHSRLLLERAAIASYHNVDRIAESELHMRFPETVTRIAPARGKH